MAHQILPATRKASTAQTQLPRLSGRLECEPYPAVVPNLASVSPEISRYLREFPHLGGAPSDRNIVEALRLEKL
jgi:hypothetical protein